jgi:hypothetical protein
MISPSSGPSNSIFVEKLGNSRSFCRGNFFGLFLVKLAVILSMPPLKVFFHPYDVQFEIMTWLLVDWALNLKKVSFFETCWQILSWKNGVFWVFFGAPS